MIDFSNNINFLGPPSGFDSYINKNINLYCKYPDHLQSLAREFLASYFSGDQDCFLLTVGATELLSVMPLFSRGIAIGISPAFWEYQFFFSRYHKNESYSKILLKYENNFSISYETITDMLSHSNADLVYLANPNNPTATNFPRNFFVDLVINFPKKLFVVDETYLMFCSDFQERTLFGVAAQFKNLVVVSSVSKIFSLPGLRLGYCNSHPANIKKLLNHNITYGVSPISADCLTWLFQQSEFLLKTRTEYTKRREYFSEKAKSLFGEKLKIFPSSTAFVLIKIKELNSNQDVCLFLKQQGIIVRSGHEFSELGKEWIRVSIRDYKEIDKLLETLGEAIHTAD